MSSKQLSRSLCRSHLTFFSGNFVNVQIVQLYNSTGCVQSSLLFISETSDFQIDINLSIPVQAFSVRLLTSLTVNVILLPMYVNLSAYFNGLLFHE